MEEVIIWNSGNQEGFTTKYTKHTKTGVLPTEHTADTEFRPSVFRVVRVFRGQFISVGSNFVLFVFFVVNPSGFPGFSIQTSLQ
jgi:hypothetical protein